MPSQGPLHREVPRAQRSAGPRPGPGEGPPPTWCVSHREARRVEELCAKNQQLREQQKALKENVRVLENR